MMCLTLNHASAGGDRRKRREQSTLMKIGREHPDAGRSARGNP